MYVQLISTIYVSWLDDISYSSGLPLVSPGKVVQEKHDIERKQLVPQFVEALQNSELQMPWVVLAPSKNSSLRTYSCKLPLGDSTKEEAFVYQIN
ncbi:hypothetical protein M5689_018245 [Euphorbia peplus]|nr:hypothetical protein M5689_018245 [Euphorbia peplus]